MPTNLIFILIGLLFLLIMLVAIYVGRMRQRASESAKVAQSETFETLVSMLKDRKTPAIELRRASEAITQRYGTITGDTIGVYLQLIEILCTHPHTESKIIVEFEKTLRRANPRFREEIAHALAHGLAKRG